MVEGAGTEIAARLSDYYRRQIAWLHESVGALDAILARAEEPDYDRWTEEDRVRARRLDELVAEYAALKKEWDASRGVPADDRDAVASLAGEVALLRGRFDERRIAVTARLAETLYAMRGEAGELKRGRENARKYGTDEESGGAIVDRRA